MLDLQPPRHISTLRIFLLAVYRGEGRFTLTENSHLGSAAELVFMPHSLSNTHALTGGFPLVKASAARPASVIS